MGREAIASEAIAKARREVTVPEMPGGRSDEPLDLGEIPLIPVPPRKVLKVVRAGAGIPRRDARRSNRSPSATIAASSSCSTSGPPGAALAWRRRRTSRRRSMRSGEMNDSR